MREITKKQEAFTLIEMIVAITVFMFFLGFAFSSFQSVTRANAAATEAQKLYRDARHVLETLADDIRANTLDFTCLAQPGPGAKTDISCAESSISDGRNKKILPLISADGLRRTVYKFEDGRLIQFTTVRPNTRSIFAAPTNESWKAVNSGNLPLTSILFTVAPVRSPLEATNAADDAIQVQPIVRIRLVSDTITLQASYSSRTYGKHALYD
ncbi:hypothetical protein COV82_02570 [Candidatus Peregrinibacteria bacterium CG11_big_fil_rev_8_21_14_0_20_46_8]|nr:MAG: hypothetical protein COV82_02570 [Candidatus Peregrinibacteria bacterium CG11_big_fil_rev_8_21_14_0_20_46_8]